MQFHRLCGTQLQNRIMFGGSWHGRVDGKGIFRLGTQKSTRKQAQTTLPRRKVSSGPSARWKLPYHAGTDG